MEKNKKIIIALVVLIVLIVLGVGIYFLINSNTQKEDTAERLSALNSKLLETQKYTVEMTIDKDNKLYYAKNGEMAYSDLYSEGVDSKFITKEENAYFIQESEKAYYKYENNSEDLIKITSKLETLLNNSGTTGTEKINGKNYKYEEYEGSDEFLIKNAISSGESTKIRFYFSNDKLEYIKTIFSSGEELAKVNISYSTDDKLFEIPSEYQEQQ